MFKIKPAPLPRPAERLFRQYSYFNKTNPTASTRNNHYTVNLNKNKGLPKRKFRIEYKSSRLYPFIINTKNYDDSLRHNYINLHIEDRVANSLTTLTPILALCLAITPQRPNHPTMLEDFIAINDELGFEDMSNLMAETLEAMVPDMTYSHRGYGNASGCYVEVNTYMGGCLANIRYGLMINGYPCDDSVAYYTSEPLSNKELMHHAVTHAETQEYGNRDMFRLRDVMSQLALHVIV